MSTDPDIAAAPPRGPWRLALDRFRRNRPAIAASAVLALLLVAALIGPALAPHDFDYVDWDYIGGPPSAAHAYYFGADAIGRDLLARTLQGLGVSLLVGFVGAAVSLAIGLTYGAVAGYAGGRIDNAMMRFVDILYALPFMFFVIMLMTFFPRSLLLVFVAIGAVEWLTLARIVRGQTLALKTREFVEAAVACGLTPGQIIARHIVPNLLGPVIVFATLTVPGVIMIESFLSFLGLGVQEPYTSLGVLISDGAAEIETAPWMFLFPAGTLALVLLAFNLIGDGLRDALDPRG